MRKNELKGNDRTHSKKKTDLNQEPFASFYFDKFISKEKRFQHLLRTKMPKI